MKENNEALTTQRTQQALTTHREKPTRTVELTCIGGLNVQ